MGQCTGQEEYNTLATKIKVILLCKSFNFKSAQFWCNAPCINFGTHLVW